ncbi:MAG: SMC-Scp complex subunit ScpB, partial [Acidobacteriaceae bacterium]|nr:SMC-Scp complex subunit ScpB [Acidobacteriaceae bacterium]
MSIRAKIEAVIYAAEEPVTLAQLAGLLGEDAVAALEAEQQYKQNPEHDAPVINAERAIGRSDASADGHDAAIAEPETVEAEQDETVAQGDGASGAELFADEAAREKRAAKEKERAIRDYLRRETDALIAEYQETDRGMEIREVAGGYRMSTKPEYHDAVRGFVKSLKPPMKLTLQALETLAVIAYKQPVTAPEISEIRGVDSSGVLGSLISRKLITTAGRKQVIGRPILYKTTKDFLLRFGLKDVAELPSIEEFEKMAGALAEQDALPIVDEIAAATELES